MVWSNYYRHRNCNITITIFGQNLFLNTESDFNIDDIVHYLSNLFQLKLQKGLRFADLNMGGEIPPIPNLTPSILRLFTLYRRSMTDLHSLFPPFDDPYDNTSQITEPMVTSPPNSPEPIHRQYKQTIRHSRTNCRIQLLLYLLWHCGQSSSHPVADVATTPLVQRRHSWAADSNFVAPPNPPRYQNWDQQIIEIIDRSWDEPNPLDRLSIGEQPFGFRARGRCYALCSLRHEVVGQQRLRGNHHVNVNITRQPIGVHAITEFDPYRGSRNNRAQRRNSGNWSTGSNNANFHSCHN